MFRLKNWPQNRSKIFYNFALAFDSSSLEKKITAHKSNRAEEKERRERQSFQKSRVLYVLSVRSWWLERTRKRCAVRDDAHTDTRAHA